MDRPAKDGGADVRPDEDESDERRVRRRGAIVERRVLVWIAAAAVAIGGCVGAMRGLSDPQVYEISERAKRDESALLALVGEEGAAKQLVARNAIGTERDTAATASATGDPVAEVLGNDPMSAIGALMGDAAGESYGFGGLGLIGTGRGGGGVGEGAIGYGAAVDQNAVLQNSFISGTGVRARLEDLLDRGVDVDGERVRLRAFTDRHGLPYPVPTDRAVALHAELERPRVSNAGDRVHLAVSLVARRGERPRRPRMDVRLVLDVSGSMAGDAIAHALAAARRLVSRLRPTDGIGIIAYETEARMVLAPTRVGDGESARRALRTLDAGGGTNIEAGLALVQAAPPRRDHPADVGLVVLVSDGEATDGLTTPDGLGSISRQLYEEHGALTTTIGLGTSFDEATMLTIAREGSGSYHFVRRSEDIGDVLTDELDERVQAVAQALRLRVELAPGVRVAKVYGTRALGAEERARVRTTELATDARIAEELGVTRDRATEEGGIRMHLPTFRRSDDHVVLFELDLPAGAPASALDVARVYLDYKDLDRERNGHEEVAVSATRVRERAEAVASTRREVKRTVLAFQAAEALARAAELLDRGRPPEALRTLRERRDVLTVGAHLWDDAQLRRDAALLGRYERVIERAWGGFASRDRRSLSMAMGAFADRRMR